MLLAMRGCAVRTRFPRAQKNHPGPTARRVTARAWLCAVLLVMTAPALARGRRPAPPPPPPWPPALCQQAAAAAERSRDVPQGLMTAIGLIESGRPDPLTGTRAPWPWTINVAGYGLYFDSKEEAIAVTETVQLLGLASVDVGCMQVNLFYHPDAFASLDEAFEPQTNAAYAGRFLAALYGQTASWPTAAAWYHSHTPDLAEQYVYRVLAVWGQPDPAPPADWAERFSPMRRKIRLAEAGPLP